VSLEQLTGGLESAVVRAHVETATSAVPRSLIVKEMRGRNRREADVYRSLSGYVPQSSISRILGTTRHRNVEHLFMEDLGTLHEWPWNDMRVANEVCRILARLHKAAVPSDVAAGLGLVHFGGGNWFTMLVAVWEEAVG
jgi:hypothetical protein